MWGVFFLDGGGWKSDGYYLQAANAGYDGTAPVFVHSDGVVQNNAKYLPTPDFTTLNATPTPIPPSCLLFGSGLLGIFGFRMKRS